MIETERLVIRKMSEIDQEAGLDLLTNDVIKKTYMLPDFEKREDAIPLFRRLLELGEKRYIRGIYLNDYLIGYANEVEVNEKSIELGYLIHPDHHGKGYMTEALTALIPELFALGYEEVVCGAFEENPASLRVMAKAGMKLLEKTDEIEYRGKVHRCIYYSKKKRMLKYPCLVLDHDDTVVQSEATVNFPFFVYILDQYRPGTTVTLDEYVHGCCQYGFADMCRKWYNFTEQELIDEYNGWQDYIKDHIPVPFAGIENIIRRQKEDGGLVCVVSHSCNQNISRDYAAHFGLQPDEIFGWDYPEHQRKPSPYPLERIMEKYNLRPDQLLVVDDMKPAWEMARKVDVPIAFAAWGREDYPEIIKEMTNLCDFTFHSTTDLEKFLFEEG